MKTLPKWQGRLIAGLVLLIAVTAALGAAPATLSFDSLYKYSVFGLTFSDQVKQNAGKEVTVEGFMAPPLRAKGNFFVLTKQPVSLCPFCNSDADWPDDIIVVYLEKAEVFKQLNRTIKVTGTLETGSYRDPETGFVSQLRLVDAKYK